MKKQILLLTLFSLAILFAGMNAIGQVPYQTVPDDAPTCLTPKPLNCEEDVDELHPVQGQMYTYTVNTTSADDDVRWFVVNNNDLTTDGDSLINKNNELLASNDTRIDPATGDGDYIYELGTNNEYNVDPTTDDQDGVSSDGTEAHSIDISWKFFDGTQPNEVLLVGVVTDDAGCTDNIAVYRIIPMPAFTIDIAVLNDNGDSIAAPGTEDAGECVSPIESAFYESIDDVSPNGTLTVDYGENWVFFVVNGANYIDSWLPEFQLSYTGGDAVPTAEASWAYAANAADAADANWNEIDGTLGETASDWTTDVPVVAGGPDNSVGDGEVPAAGGECIVVRVRLDWGTDIEHDQIESTLTFAANGVAYDGDGTTELEYFDDDTNFEDLHHESCATDGFTNDVVDYLITPRPQIEEGTPDQEIKTGEGIN